MKLKNVKKMKNKKDYQYYKNKKICIQCKKEKALKNRVRCGLCLYLDKIYRQNKRNGEDK